ncbi:muellerian-inhibiting factor [Electrophorus electricus]|uniref:muellerian-inhibiting factor n=1 Tax=Electrophorus electricus TaxID=8005 RepID=UPI0015CFBE6A|nr:muellerian-inhibiting factor [Electrophorus electricus]
MDEQTGLWLLLLLQVTVVSGALSTAERELDANPDLLPAQLRPAHSGENGGEGESNKGHVPYGRPLASVLAPLQCLMGDALCLNEQQHHTDALGDFLLALRDARSKEPEPGKEEFSQFGMCSHFDGVQRSQFPSLFMLSKKEHKENRRLGFLHTKKEHWEVDEDGDFTLTLHLAKHHKDYQATLDSTLLLFFVGRINVGEFNLKFSSPALQPNKQTVCVSTSAQFLVLTGGQATGFSHDHVKLKIVVEPQNGNEQKMGLSELQTFMVRKNRSDIKLGPVVLFFQHATNSEGAQHSSGTFHFLSELQKFLNEVLAQRNPPRPQDVSTPAAWGVLHSLPPLTLGASTSESLLLELVNSSGPTMFSFPQQGVGLWTHRVELDLSLSLLSLLRLRLDEALAQVRLEKAERSVMDRLQTLTKLTAFPDNRGGAETGLGNPSEVPYRALLLLKALQAVLGTWAVERAQRAARAGQDAPTGPSQCRLQSLTVNLERYFLEPRMANINNCEGACGFPLINENNHAMLLNAQVQSGQPLSRRLCCVPVDYEDLCVIELDSEGTLITYKTNMVAKRCGCR